MDQMSTLNHIKELTAGECPDWVCEQIAEYLDERDARLAASQAREQQLRELVKANLNGEWSSIQYEEATNLLALPADMVMVPRDMYRQLKHYTICHLMNFPDCGAPTEAEIAAAEKERDELQANELEGIR